MLPGGRPFVADREEGIGGDEADAAREQGGGGELAELRSCGSADNTATVENRSDGSAMPAASSARAGACRTGKGTSARTVVSQNTPSSIRNSA